MEQPRHLRFAPFVLLLITVCSGMGDSAGSNGRWDPRFALQPGISGYVSAATTIGSNVFVGGFFTQAGNVAATNLARWDGTNWFPVGGGVDGSIFCLCTDGTNLIVGGIFKKAGSLDATNIAQWTGTHWTNFGSGITRLGEPGGGPAVVMGLSVDGPNLFAGGHFDQAGGIGATNVAVWNGNAWNPLGNGIGSEFGYVQALAAQSGKLYAGGLFIQAGTAGATNVAVWNGSSWGQLGRGLSGGTRYLYHDGMAYYGWVRSLALNSGKLYAGGHFAKAGGVNATNLAVWNGTAWAQVGGGVGGDRDDVVSICSRSAEIVITGTFRKAGGVAATNIARWDGTAWHRLRNGIRGEITSAAYFGTNVYAGGHFSSIDGVSMASIARWNGSTWGPLGSGTGQAVTGDILALAAAGNDVYATGSFETAGTTNVSNLARWDGAQWRDVGHGISGAGSVLAVSGSNVYVGGYFVVTNATNLARWNGVKWSGLGTGLRQLGTNAGTVSALAIGGDRLFVSGDFDRAGGVAATNIAMWNGSQWASMGSPPIHYGSFVRTYTLVASSNTLYAGGDFSSIGGVEAKGIAGWDGTSWFDLGGGLSRNSDVGSVDHTALVGDNLYVSGYFDQAGGVAATNFARWDGTNWSALDHPFTSQQLISCMVVSAGNLFVSGYFDQVAGLPANGMARWDGTQWTPLGNGLRFQSGSGNGRVLAAGGRKVYVAGLFQIAGDTPSYNFAIWHEYPDIHLGPLQRMNNNSVFFQINNGIGQRVQVQYSSDLMTWVPLAEKTLQSVHEDFLDSPVPVGGRRHYRVQLLP